MTFPELRPSLSCPRCADPPRDCWASTDPVRLRTCPMTDPAGPAYDSIVAGMLGRRLARLEGQRPPPARPCCPDAADLFDAFRHIGPIPDD